MSSSSEELDDADTPSDSSPPSESEDDPSSSHPPSSLPSESGSEPDDESDLDPEENSDADSESASLCSSHSSAESLNPYFQLPSEVTRTEHNAVPAVILPNEILGEIFCAARDATNKDPGLKVRRFLATITSICVVWRQVALSTPRLWSIIEGPYVPSRRSPPALQGLKRALQLSGNTSLELKYHTGFHNANYWYQTTVIQTMYRELNRCRKLYLGMGLPGELEQVLFPLPRKMERLESLTIRDPSGQIEDSVVRRSTTIPLLRELSFRGCSYSPLQHIPTANLANLVLDGADFQAAWKFIAQCPSLRYLHLIDTCDLPHQHHPIVLAQLECLILRDKLSASIRCVLTAPKLDHFTLCASFRDAETHMPEVYLPPFPSLRKLTLWDAALEIGPLHALMLSQPLIDALILITCAKVEGLLKLLVKGVPSSFAVANSESLANGSHPHSDGEPPLPDHFHKNDRNPAVLPSLSILRFHAGSLGIPIDEFTKYLEDVFLVRPQLKALFSTNFRVSAQDWEQLKAQFGERLEMYPENHEFD